MRACDVLVARLVLLRGVGVGLVLAHLVVTRGPLRSFLLSVLARSESRKIINVYKDNNKI